MSMLVIAVLVVGALAALGGYGLGRHQEAHAARIRQRERAAVQALADTLDLRVPVACWDVHPMPSQIRRTPPAPIQAPAQPNAHDAPDAHDDTEATVIGPPPSRGAVR